VENLFLLKNYPLSALIGVPLNGLLVFQGVTSSRRKLTEYIGSRQKPEGFKDEYEVIDIAMEENTKFNGISHTFLFEGLMENPVAWVNWDVIAETFELQLRVA
jgi:hypothetical protein